MLDVVSVTIGCVIAIWELVSSVYGLGDGEGRRRRVGAVCSDRVGDVKGHLYVVETLDIEVGRAAFGDRDAARRTHRHVLSSKLT